MKYATLWLPDDIEGICITEIRSGVGNMMMEAKLFVVEQSNAGALNATDEQEAHYGQA